MNPYLDLKGEFTDENTFVGMTRIEFSLYPYVEYEIPDTFQWDLTITELIPMWGQQNRVQFQPDTPFCSTLTGNISLTKSVCSLRKDLTSRRLPYVSRRDLRIQNRDSSVNIFCIRTPGVSFLP